MEEEQNNGGRIMTVFALWRNNPDPHDPDSPLPTIRRARSAPSCTPGGWNQNHGDQDHKKPRIILPPLSCPSHRCSLPIIFARPRKGGGPTTFRLVGNGSWGEFA